MQQDAIPADLATLACAVPGQELVIRALIGRSRACRRVFAPDDRVVCLDVAASGFVVCTAAGTIVGVPRDCARAIQVERVGFGSGARMGVVQRAMPFPLLTAGPVHSLLPRVARTVRAGCGSAKNHDRDGHAPSRRAAMSSPTQVGSQASAAPTHVSDVKAIASLRWLMVPVADQT